MRMRDLIVCLTSVVVAVGLIYVAGSRLDSINTSRKEMDLVINEPLENAPPSLAFATVAMGAFRGLIVDVLWMRADRLKEEGQFFDARQLAEWITALQPRFAEVWEFQAWNMAYNISVAIPAEQPDQRWRWVKNGYELLRDKGIPLNPKSILLYRELGRIFQHKIGGLSDDAHRYYKLQLAKALEPLLGPADEAWFDALAEAPAEWEQVAGDPNIARFIDALKAADQTFADDESRFVANYLSLRQNPQRFDPNAFEVINDFRGTDVLRRFDVFAKAHQLRTEWKLDLNLVRELNRTYGPVEWEEPNKHLPLDWRSADVHAIYWAVKGLRELEEPARPTEGKEYSVHEANTDRIVAHSLQNLFRHGRIFIYTPTVQSQANPDATEQPQEELYLRPDLRMFDPYNEAVLAIIEKYRDPNLGVDTGHEVGHRNMLKNAVLAFYQAGHRGKAQSIYRQLRDLYPRDEFRNSSVEWYVRQRLREELDVITITNVREMTLLALREAYFRYAMRDDNEAAGREKFAKEVYDYYYKEWTEEERVKIAPFPVLRYQALQDFLSDTMYPETMRRNLLARIKIERPDLAETFRKLEEEMIRKAPQPQ